MEVTIGIVLIQLIKLVSASQPPAGSAGFIRPVLPAAMEDPF
jgi:hypothetical protein